MKHSLKIIVVFGLGLLCLPVVFSAPIEKATDEEGLQLPDLQVKGMKSLPVPIKQVAPEVNSRLAGMEIVMKFSVDKKGRPYAVRSAKALAAYWDPRERDFATYMGHLLKQWKFEPARLSNGEAIQVDMIMPVKIVDRDKGLTVLASFRLDEGNKDRS